ncbi:hypothetical protein MPDQ_007604 [Monascus purpureus]|uniref:Amino acid permease/ SLC12A domain-containing protein n=1 Tax=Monascus purpureus TaxID=5098 RepID=A0A507QV58_MONPU|nr:hypothetical protein MPDQ_007604 [Monascus purpureus]BDD56096.1 hypothetical protein MAP00_001572 [Monascus purpureus]
MAIIPTIGTGVFIAAGQALAVGGPASLLISYGFISILVYCMTTAVGEISAHRPDRNGTLIRHGYKYGSQSLGFSMGYLRWYSLAMMVPFEITTATVNIGLWTPSPTVAVRVSLMTAVMIGFNLLPERMFRRSESVFTGLKLTVLSGLLIFSVVLTSGGVPASPARGFGYWYNPGAFAAYLTDGSLGRFLGVLQCLLRSTIAFLFTPELSISRAEGAESSTHSNILRKAQSDNIQLSVLYLLAVLAIGVVSPSNDPLLTNNGTGAGFSPFFLAIQQAQIGILPNIVSLAILVSSVSSGRSFLFASSQQLYSLSESGHGPAIFKRRTNWGVPYVALATSSLFAGFAFLSMLTSSSIVFNWLLHFITTSGYLSWLCSCIVYLRFRRMTHVRDAAPRPKAWIQPYGAYFGILICILLPLMNGFSFVVPSNFNVSQLVTAYMGIPAFLILYLGHQLMLGIGLRAYHPEDISLEPVEVRETQENQEGQETSEATGEGPSGQEPWWKKAKSSAESPFRLGRHEAEGSEV